MRIASVAAIALAALTLGSTARAACPTNPPGPLDNGTSPNGANNDVYASILWDPDGSGPATARLVVAGAFTSIGGVVANHVAQLDPVTGQWEALGAGFPKVALCLTVWNNQLVVGGIGDNDPGTPDDNLATYDGSTWTTLYQGTSIGSVYTVAVVGGELYAGGNFTIFPTGGDPAYNIAHWNSGGGHWEAMPAMGTVPGPIVEDLTAWNGLLYAATWNGATYPSAVGGIWHFNGAWTMDVSADNSINALQPFNGELVACGTFDKVGGTSIQTVLGFNGSTVHGFGTGMNAECYTLTVFGGNLYCGGYFTQASGNGVNYVAEWNGSSWVQLFGGTETNGYVYSLLADGVELVIGGHFTHVANGTTAANHLARWDGNFWSAFNAGEIGTIRAMTKYSGMVVAGGSFDQSDDPATPAHSIIGWNGSTLSSFGIGMDNEVMALGSYSFGIGVNRTSELVAGGFFMHAGGTACTHIAKWDQSFVAFPPPAWAPLGAGVDNAVYAVERATFSSTANIYAGGAFTHTGATSLPYIGRYNASSQTWEAMGSGMNGAVWALKYFNGFLYAGGDFTTAGGVSTGGLARWNGSSWSACGGFFNGNVRALEIYNGVLAIGGSFPGTGGSPGIAFYDGTSYTVPGTGGVGAGGTAYALHAVGTRLYIAGNFTTLGGNAAGNFGYWDGASWHSLNGMPNNFALSDLGPEVEIGGDNWLRYNGAGAAWYSSQPFSTSRAPGTTVDFTARPASGYAAGTEQWYKNGNPLSDGPSPSGSTVSGSATVTLDIANVQVGDEGDYQAITPTGCGPDSSNVATLTIQGNSTGVGDPHAAFADAFLGVGPNPSRGAGTLRFSLARDGEVRLRVLDVAGRQLGRFELGHVGAGAHRLVWEARDENGRPLRAGLYFVALERDGRPLGNQRVTIIR